jgi:hypothetical protein
MAQPKREVVRPEPKPSFAIPSKVIIVIAAFILGLMMGSLMPSQEEAPPILDWWVYDCVATTSTNTTNVYFFVPVAYIGGNPPKSTVFSLRGTAHDCTRVARITGEYGHEYTENDP